MQPRHLARHTLLVLAAAWLCGPATAQQPRAPAVAASAAGATASAPGTAASAPVVSAPMAIVGEWQGPFQETKVLKLVDAEDGVACYFYLPSNVPSNTVCTGKDACAIHYPSGIGTMSCVKVREPRAAAKGAPGAANRATPQPAAQSTAQPATRR